MFKKERKYWITALAILIILWIATLKFYKGIANDKLYKNLELFNQVLSLVQETYVEEPDPQKLIYGAIDGMLASLGDPYTRFMREESYNELKVETEGKFGGAGFVITIKNDNLTIIAPMAGTPAEKAGLLPNDIILKIDDEPTKGMDLNTAVSKIRGTPGTKVKLTIMRDEFKEPKDFIITREIINVKSVFSKEIDFKNKKIGYIRIVNFAEDTPSELEKILKNYEDSKIDGIVLDLRNNPGGLLYTAWKVSDLFLDSGVIVSTIGRVHEQNNIYRASSISYCNNVPMVVLINEGSASASEIVTGALRDNKRAIVVGEKSFGKGVVQTVRELGNNLAVAITTARYYTPSGVCIDKEGIHPDIEVKTPKLKKNEIEQAEKILKNNYIEKFLQKNKNFSELPNEKKVELLNSLVKELNSEGIDADYNLVRRLVKSKINETKVNEAVVDLEDDVQLKKAVEVVTLGK
jgi:carboxyl-terminal processing protease